MKPGASFSSCRTWRYALWRPLVDFERLPRSRQVAPKTCLFVCLNPSTADEETDDPTVRRCVGFAHGWGFDLLVVCNLFGLRSTDPRVLREHPDPVGDMNDAWIMYWARGADRVVAAWGAHGSLNRRSQRVLDKLVVEANASVYVLGLTAKGEPKHPLYLRRDLEPVLLHEAVKAASCSL